MKKQFKFTQYRFSPTLFATAVATVCILTFIKLGLWQYHKAELKQKIQASYAESEVTELKNFLQTPIALNYHKAVVYGRYETKYQILVDNQTENSEVGFHVVTPFRISGTDQYVLVNRGWIKGGKLHADVPDFETPTGELKIEGMVWQPASKIFTLEEKSSENLSDEKSWNLVWQHLDMAAYQRLAPIKVLPVIIKLDKFSHSGFVRNWQMPTERIVTHLGYAYQWFGFAFAAFAIYIYNSIRRK